MTPKLEYKQLAPGRPEGYVFTDDQGLEHMNNIADEVTTAFQHCANRERLMNQEIRRLKAKLYGGPFLKPEDRIQGE